MNNITNLISQNEERFLNLRQHPACLTVEQTAVLLGRRPEHVAILVAGGFLKPLGDPPKNGVKHFATVEVLEKIKDSKWLDKVSGYLTKHWQDKNGKARQKFADQA